MKSKKVAGEGELASSDGVVRGSLSMEVKDEETIPSRQSEWQQQSQVQESACCEDQTLESRETIRTRSKFQLYFFSKKKGRKVAFHQ